MIAWPLASFAAVVASAPVVEHLFRPELSACTAVAVFVHDAGEPASARLAAALLGASSPGREQLLAQGGQARAQVRPDALLYIVDGPPSACDQVLALAAAPVVLAGGLSAVPVPRTPSSAMSLALFGAPLAPTAPLRVEPSVVFFENQEPVPARPGVAPRPSRPARWPVPKASEPPVGVHGDVVFGHAIAPGASLAGAKGALLSLFLADALSELSPKSIEVIATVDRAYFAVVVEGTASSVLAKARASLSRALASTPSSAYVAELWRRAENLVMARRLVPGGEALEHARRFLAGTAPEDTQPVEAWLLTYLEPAALRAVALPP